MSGGAASWLVPEHQSDRSNERPRLSDLVHNWPEVADTLLNEDQAFVPVVPAGRQGAVCGARQSYLAHPLSGRSDQMRSAARGTSTHLPPLQRGAHGAAVVPRSMRLQQVPLAGAVPQVGILFVRDEFTSRGTTPLPMTTHEQQVQQANALFSDYVGRLQRSTSHGTPQHSVVRNSTGVIGHAVEHDSNGAITPIRGPVVQQVVSPSTYNHPSPHSRGTTTRQRHHTPRLTATDEVTPEPPRSVVRDPWYWYPHG